VLEQRVAGSFLEFSLSHPARSEGAVVTTGTTTSFRNCQLPNLAWVNLEVFRRKIQSAAEEG
jgi:hypothetical protein